MIFCGNGGSFSDAQHFTAELIVRYKRDRVPLSSLTLGCNSSITTACSNDYDYEQSNITRNLEKELKNKNKKLKDDEINKVCLFLTQLWKYELSERLAIDDLLKINFFD